MPDVKGIIIKRTYPFYVLIRRSDSRNRNLLYYTIVKELIRFCNDNNQNADIGFKIWLAAYSRDVFYRTDGLVSSQSIDLNAVFSSRVRSGGQGLNAAVGQLARTLSDKGHGNAEAPVVGGERFFIFAITRFPP